jgi:hypothetical protein
MDETITHIYFDGGFWVALVERHAGAETFLARHVFGSEPSNPELLRFCLETLPRLDFLKAISEFKPPKSEKRGMPAAGAPSAFERYKESVRERCMERKAESRAARELSEDERYAARQAKRREKRRGH